MIQVQYKEAEGSSLRDGTYGESPGTPKVRNMFYFGIVHILFSMLKACG